VVATLHVGTYELGLLLKTTPREFLCEFTLADRTEESVNEIGSLHGLFLIFSHYLFLPFFILPAFLIAIAIACFCGLPCFISVPILAEIVFLELPRFNGILNLLQDLVVQLALLNNRAFNITNLKVAVT
jgi:hypothetical protein